MPAIATAYLRKVKLFLMNNPPPTNDKAEAQRKHIFNLEEQLQRSDMIITSHIEKNHKNVAWQMIKRILDV